PPGFRPGPPARASAARSRSIPPRTPRSPAALPTLKPMTPASRPPGVGRSDDDTRTYIVGRLPTVTGSPRSAFRAIDVVCAPEPVSNVTSTLEPYGPRSRVTAARHASTCASRGRVSSVTPARRVRAGGPAIDQTVHPAWTPAAAA